MFFSISSFQLQYFLQPNYTIEVYVIVLSYEKTTFYLSCVPIRIENGRHFVCVPALIAPQRNTENLP